MSLKSKKEIFEELINYCISKSKTFEVSYNENGVCDVTIKSSFGTIRVNESILNVFFNGKCVFNLDNQDVYNFINEYPTDSFKFIKCIDSVKYDKYTEYSIEGKVICKIIELENLFNVIESLEESYKEINDLEQKLNDKKLAMGFYIDHI